MLIFIAQLTSLSGYQPALRGLLEIPYGYYNSLPSTPDRILASRLHWQSLEFHGLTGGSLVGSILDHVTIPNLRELSFKFRAADYGIHPFPVSTFLSFISRSCNSCCLLQNLSLSGLILQDDDVLAYTQATPSLTGLTLEARSITNQTIRNLNPNTSPLLPNLQILSISSARLVVNFSDPYDTMFARSRFGSGKIAQLQTVKIRAIDADRDIYELRLLRRLATEGIEISVANRDFEKWLGF